MNLNNYICTDKFVEGVPYSHKIITPKGKNNVRSMEKLKGINYIVVHNTGNTSPSADAKAHGNYLQNVENNDRTYVSWHLTVDNNSCIQHLPFNEVGFHAGDGKGAGNRQGIGIEICENNNYTTSEINGIKIICGLMKKFNIPIERVLPHRYFSSEKKLCPHRILKSQTLWKSNWKSFQNRIMSEYNKTNPYITNEEIKVNSIVTIKKNAKYGGLSYTRNSLVPISQTETKNHTVSLISTFYGEKEALLKEINSWVPLKNLNLKNNRQQRHK